MQDLSFGFLMSFKSIHNVLYILKEELSYSEFLGIIKKIPRNLKLYIEIDKKNSFLFSISKLKEIAQISENKHLFFICEDESLAKLINSVGLLVSPLRPKEYLNYNDEFHPPKKFRSNKLGEAFSSENIEIIKIIREGSEEKLNIVKAKYETMTTTNKVVLSMLVIVASMVSLFLFALIVPSAKIKVEPKRQVFSHIVNLNFVKTKESYNADIKNHDNNFHLYPIEILKSEEIIFPVLSKIFEGQNSKGIVTLYNKYSDPITLKKGTRLQTNDGLFFFTTHYVSIPKSKKVKNDEGIEELTAGSAKVEVVASELDLYQEIIGSRGNIPPQSFFIPGLTNYMQKFIWGESEETFSGGTTRWRKEVSKEDQIAAEAKLSKVLEHEATIELEKFLADANKGRKRKIRHLPISEYFNTELVKISFDESLLGKNLDEFSIKGEMLITAYVFYEQDVFDFLREHLHIKRNPLMKIDQLDYNNLAYRKFAETPLEIRVATEIKGSQSYKVDLDSESGKLFQEKVKKELRGELVDNAKKWINNQEEVSQAEITIFPPIKKHLPLVKDNIKIIEIK